MSGANIGRLGADVTFESSGPSARYGGAAPSLGIAPTRDVKTSRIVGVQELVGGSGVLGSGSSAANAAASDGLSERERRAAHFDKMFAEKKAKQMEANERLGLNRGVA